MQQHPILLCHFTHEHNVVSLILSTMGRLVKVQRLTSKNLRVESVRQQHDVATSRELKLNTSNEKVSWYCTHNCFLYLRGSQLLFQLFRISRAGHTHNSRCPSSTHIHYTLGLSFMITIVCSGVCGIQTVQIEQNRPRHCWAWTYDSRDFLRYYRENPSLSMWVVPIRW